MIARRNANRQQSTLNDRLNFFRMLSGMLFCGNSSVWTETNRYSANLKSVERCYVAERCVSLLESPNAAGRRFLHDTPVPLETIPLLEEGAQ